MKYEDVPMSKITVGPRHRSEMGDLEALAANIREMGLLQPIGIDRYYHLIFGERRLLACQILNWDTMPCAVLNLQSVLAGEYAENEFRKQFTPSEREAVGRAIEAELGKRAGRPAKIVKKVSPFQPGEKTRDIAATKAGFGNAMTYEQAKKVVERGTPELIAAMDRREVSISAAACIATQPKTDQRRIITLPKDERREVVSQIRKSKADQEANERRARDVRLFRGLHDAVKFIAEFTESPADTWPGITRVSALNFPENLDRALDFLTRLRKAHPNALREPKAVG